MTTTVGAQGENQSGKRGVAKYLELVFVKLAFKGFVGGESL